MVNKTDNALEIKNLTVQYVTGDEVVRAVTDVSITIPTGKTHSKHIAQLCFPASRAEMDK